MLKTSSVGPSPSDEKARIAPDLKPARDPSQWMESLERLSRLGGYVLNIALRHGLGSELDIKLVKFVRFCLGGGNPFLHVRQLHDGSAIGGTLAVQLDIIGEKPRHHRRIHG